MRYPPKAYKKEFESVEVSGVSECRNVLRLAVMQSQKNFFFCALFVSAVVMKSV